ncbi:MAG TPA: rhodanese-like domain-containing protein [Gemmataceae bacterium]|nr:rhodanese-like domain-containing protein [Gemmataceae bacterium]
MRTSAVVHEISVQQLQAKLRAGEPVYLLDVRQAWEHDLASLPGSCLIPLDQLSLRADEVQPPERTAVVVYCHHGIRSRTGAAILQQRGLIEVFSLAGGIDAWSRLIDPQVPRY